MTFTEFIRTKELFDNGSMESIRNADLDAFLFENKWYPVRQFVASIHQGVNNQEAIKKLVLLIPYLRIKENVDFRGSTLPVLRTAVTSTEFKFSQTSFFINNNIKSQIPPNAIPK